VALGFIAAGNASVSSSSTITVPLTADIPASTPTGGGTIVIPFVLADNDFSIIPIAASDDAEATGVYGDCIFDDGLNHYADGFPPIGLILNDLTTSNSVTLDMGAVASYLTCGIYAVTGIDLSAIAGSESTPPDWLYAVAWQLAEAPHGAPTANNESVRGIGTGAIVDPLGGGTLGSPDWDWYGGNAALYFVSDNLSSEDTEGWGWDDGSITDFDQFSSTDGSHYYSVAVGLQNPMTAGALGPVLSGAWGDSSSQTFTVWRGFAFAAGLGPTCGSVSGPWPAFDHRFRVGD